MSISDVQINAWMAAFFWPFLRIGAMVMAAPVFNSRQVPKRIRLVIAVFLTVAIAPTIPTPPVVSLFGYEAFMIALQQILIGIATGFIMQMVFSAIVFGGQTIALSMGLGFASMVDPQNGVQVPVVSQYYVILATLTFLVLNGHLFLIDILSESFHTLPIAIDGLSRSSIHEVVAWASRMFSGGLLIALPAMTSLLLINLGMGIVSRAAPQLNIFAIGFPITMMTGFILMMVTVPDVMANFGDLLNEGAEQVMRLLLITR